MTKVGYFFFSISLYKTNLHFKNYLTKSLKFLIWLFLGAHLESYNLPQGEFGIGYRDPESGISFARIGIDIKLGIRSKLKKTLVKHLQPQ